MPCSLDLTLNGSLRFNRIISHWIAFSCNVYIVHNVYYILGNYFVCMFRICCATTHMFVKTFSHILWFVCLFVHDLIEWMCVYSSIWKFWFIENIHILLVYIYTYKSVVCNIVSLCFKLPNKTKRQTDRPTNPIGQTETNRTKEQLGPFNNRFLTLYVFFS